MVDWDLNPGGLILEAAGDGKEGITALVLSTSSHSNSVASRPASSLLVPVVAASQGWTSYSSSLSSRLSGAAPCAAASRLSARSLGLEPGRGWGRGGMDLALHQ